MTPALTCSRRTQRDPRPQRLARRSIDAGARALTEFARPLPTPVAHGRCGRGRTVGVIVHHVASVYPLEVRLAQMLAAGSPIVGVTWHTVHEMNAAHAAEFEHVTKPAALALLAENSAAAAAAIRTFSDGDLNGPAIVSLYADAELTCQFMLEDHAVRHSYHHLARLRATLER